MRLTPNTSLATWLAAASLIALTACHPDPAASDTADAKAVRHLGKLAFEPCTLASPYGNGNLEAQCGTLQVAENPQAPQGRKIALNIAWLPATDEGSATPDPVFFLAGGPGQAATEHAVLIDMALREVRKQRDVVLVDQRGTGKSNPLTCNDAEGESPSASDIETMSDEAVRVETQRCVDALAKRADLRYYTTTDAVRDLDAVRAAIGAEQINLVGVSYGTRVAQQYAATHPTHTRSLVLDGVAPNTLVVGGEFARRFDESLDRQSRACAADPACHKRYPTDLRARLLALKQRLAQAPVEVDYRDPSTGEQKHGTLTGSTVTGLSHAFSYMPATMSLLPLVIDEADQGRYGPLMSLAQFMEGQVSGQMARGMQLSVVCAEDADRYQPDPADANTVMGADLARLFFSPCSAWPKGARPANFNAPLKSPVPALLMSGELDPVTPPSYAEQVVQGLPKGRHFVLHGQGHNVIAQGCMPKLVGQFIETGDAKALDGKCLDSIDGTPAFTGFNGWEP